jgi:hypothetical protein
MKEQGQSIQDMLKAFMKDGGTVIACMACSQAAGLTESDFIEGVKMGNPDLVKGFCSIPPSRPCPGSGDASAYLLSDCSTACFGWYPDEEAASMGGFPFLRQLPASLAPSVLSAPMFSFGRSRVCLVDHFHVEGHALLWCQYLALGSKVVVLCLYQLPLGRQQIIDLRINGFLLRLVGDSQNRQLYLQRMDSALQGVFLLGILEV